jgi:hypothetical protein
VGLENSLKSAVHPSDHLEVAAFVCALIVKLVLFALRGVLNSEPPCERGSGTVTGSVAEGGRRGRRANGERERGGAAAAAAGALG